MQNTDIPTWRMLFTVSEKMRNLCGRRDFRRRATGCSEVTLSQARVLGCLFIGSEGGIKVKDIASELGITPGAVSQIVSSLEDSGYLHRVECPDDRRAVMVRLSESGMEVRRALDREFDRVSEILFRDVTARDSATFRRVLRTMLDTIENSNSANGDITK